MSLPNDAYSQPSPEQRSIIGRLLRWCLTNKLVVGLLVVLLVLWGVYVAPFDWNLGWFPRNPVPTDAIPDIGANQQIVFTNWPGRSPQDVEDQITYPLTTALLGIPGVQTVRSSSMFGFSSIYIIFEDFSWYQKLFEGKGFYWTRSRVLEKLNSLPPGTLPEGVRPMLGPDATALGQVFWYTLEGRDLDGKPAGQWDLEELRTIQDWYVRYGLLSAGGVSEVASAGGFVREYQVDVDPDAMRAYGVTLPEVYAAVKASNIDVGAKTVELNRVEYFIRGIGFVKHPADIENSVIKVNNNVPITIAQIGTVTLGPALRRGALDKDGAEAVGGVVVARYGDNPLAVIRNVKARIEEIAPSLPAKVVIDESRAGREQLVAFAHSHGFEAFDGEKLNHKAWVSYLREARQSGQPAPAWANVSQVTIQPFYDRTGLIYETLGTLNDALGQEMLVTFIVVIIMVVHLRSSLLIGGMLPLAVLFCFVAMKTFGVDANIVALSGIAIAIGTIVDMGIVICENILRHLELAPLHAPRLEVVHRAASEVGSAVLTAVSTTVVSFLPVFTMTGSRGKLFRPLAFTKTFALIASIIIALTVIPPLALMLFGGKVSGRKLRLALYGAVSAGGAALAAWGVARGSLLIALAGAALLAFGAYGLLRQHVPPRLDRFAPLAANGVVAVLVGLLLSKFWEPLGPARGLMRNVLFVTLLVGGLLGFFKLFQRFYRPVLRWCLAHKAAFLSLPGLLLIGGALASAGPGSIFGRIPQQYYRQDLSAEQRAGLSWRQRYLYDLAGLKKEKWADPQKDPGAWIANQPGRVKMKWTLAQGWDGLGQEEMPPLDEGSFLYMPTTMVHASIGEAMDVLAKQDRAFQNIPEVESVVGKIGRADTPLDPAPISMIETVITYKPEYKTDGAGRRINFKYDHRAGTFVRDDAGELIPDPDGRPFRQWRDGVRSPDDIWREIQSAGQLPGTTAAPRLQPIAARLVMLQSGMRAPMGVKVKGPSLDTIEQVGIQIERLLKQVPGVEVDSVYADRIVGKPYLEIVPDRQAMARYGVKIRQFQDIVEVAIGGEAITRTVEGRERFPIRARYQRELRDQIETLGRILVPGVGGTQIPLMQVAEVRYVRGPQVIKSEDTFLTSYVLFDKQRGEAEVDVVNRAQRFMEQARQSGELDVPAGVTLSFNVAGRSVAEYQKSQMHLYVVLAVALMTIFLIIYFQFKSVPTTLLVFSGILVAWAGGFLLIWLYGQPWFLDFSLFGVNMRDLFQVHTINLSVAVWVGFLALFGIASDNGVIQSTYLDQVFRESRPGSIEEIREATVVAAQRRVRPCLMTSATTILALIPVVTSVGRGSDVMVPMAIPSFGGMLVVLISIFVVPVLYCWLKERSFKAHRRRERGEGVGRPAAAPPGRDTSPAEA